MDSDIKVSFSRIKPVCDIMMVCPSADTIGTFVSKVTALKDEVAQELQQYLLFPFITHIKSTEIEKKYELQCMLVDAMTVVVKRVTINNYEMFMKIETGLLHLIFDNSRPGMVANVPEELKYSIMKCLTTVMLNIHPIIQDKLYKTQVPLLAQAVFVAVHIAKLERDRKLRIAAINCVMAHTGTHPQQTINYHIGNSTIEKLTVDMLSNILPGILAALQDVATCVDNPGHAVVVAALEAIHRILCVTMNDKHLAKTSDITTEDFAKMIKEKARLVEDQTEVSNKETKTPKEVEKRSPQWYSKAGDKLTLITKSVIVLRTHEHYKVRKELAVYCARVLIECNTTMQQSVPLVLHILISLSRDEHPEVSQYCMDTVNNYFSKASDDTRLRTMDGLCENFFATLSSLPRVLNNIDAGRKLAALNLVAGYIEVLRDKSRPERLSGALSSQNNMKCLCEALTEAASIHSQLTLLTQHAVRDVTPPPPRAPP